MRKDNETFAYTNTHPKKSKTTGDCVFRALSIATGKDWLTIYDELYTLGREVLAPSNDKKTYAKYLDQIGSRELVKENGRRLTGKDLALRSKATYIVRVAGHLLAVKGGKVRDTWDSGNKSAYVIWKIKK